jgi:hypothetical protein
MVPRKIGDVVRDPVTGLEETIVDETTIVFIARLMEMHAVPETLARIEAEADKRRPRAVLPFRKGKP